MNTSSYTELIKERLKSEEIKTIGNVDTSYKHAAVLIPFFREDDTLKVLFTKRTLNVEHHKGQISFPGGAVDEQDTSFLDTALRETEEEIGINSSHVSVLGRVDDVIAKASDFIIHPFVGTIPYPYNFKLSQAEVDRIIKVPLRVFDPVNSTAAGNIVDPGNVKSPVYEYKGEIIWGATARIMANVMRMIGDI